MFEVSVPGEYVTPPSRETYLEDVQIPIALLTDCQATPDDYVEKYEIVADLLTSDALTAEDRRFLQACAEYGDNMSEVYRQLGVDEYRFEKMRDAIIAKAGLWRQIAERREHVAPRKAKARA